MDRYTRGESVIHSTEHGKDNQSQNMKHSSIILMMFINCVDHSLKVVCDFF